MLTPAVKLCLAAAGVFLITGLLTGAWKYWHIERSPTAEAPYYVNIAHRASLMYAFACVVMAELARYSAFSELTNLVAAAVPILYFALAIDSYIIHGWLGDTDNQLAAPHRLGSRTVPAILIRGFMWSLAVGEIAGVTVLFAGFVLGVF